jgi:DNA-binding response OmpR family regulator
MLAAHPTRGGPPMKTVLVVDDEPKIVELARDYLERAGYRVLSAFDGKAALASARSERPDLLILDLGLPELDGLDVARALRGESAIPIVMLTGRSDESDKLVGLAMGADDYVTKPFSPKELVARVRAVLRRTERPATAADVIREGDLTLDVPRMRVTVAERQIDLTPTEFQLLATLAREPGRVFTRAQLLDAVHGVAFESYERAIDAHVKNIRRKLEPDPATPSYVLTVYGVGYRLAERDA